MHAAKAQHLILYRFRPEEPVSDLSTDVQLPLSDCQGERQMMMQSK